MRQNLRTDQDPTTRRGQYEQIFPQNADKEPEGHTVITIITDSQTTDGEEPTLTEQNDPETDEITEVYAPPSTITASRTLSAQTPMLTSSIGCSTAHSAREIGRDPAATPTTPSDDIVETAI